MFIENFLLAFGCIFLSIGFVFWTTDDFIEIKIIGSKYAKKMIVIGILSLTIMLLILKLNRH